MGLAYLIVSFCVSSLPFRVMFLEVHSKELRLPTQKHPKTMAIVPFAAEQTAKSAETPLGHSFPRSMCPWGGIFASIPRP